MDFRPAASILGFAAIFFLAVFGDRWLASRAWRDSLVAYRIRFPSGLTAEAVAKCLSVVSGATRRKPVVIEVIGTGRGIEHHLLVPRSGAAGIVSRLSAALPGIRVQEVPDYFAGCPPIRAACELRTSHVWRPLAGNRAESSISGLLASLYPLGAGECVRIQWVISGTHHVRLRGDAPPELMRSARDKQAAPVVNAVGRIAVSAQYRGRSRMLLADVLNALHVVSAPGVSLAVRYIPSAIIARRIYPRSLPLTAWPAFLNTDELAAVVGIPIADIRVPGLAVGTARQVPPSPEMPRRGLVVAHSNYPGMGERPVALKTLDRLQHMVIQGPTGTGKSTLIAHLALQDINAGRGVMVIDPKSDLVAEILSRIPDNRADDVIVIDASKTDTPVGFNILQAGHDEHSRELVVDRVVHVLSQLWRNSWGPRTADVFRAGLLTLTHTRAADGSVFTLAELPELLTNAAFRRYVTSQRGVPYGVRDFWTAYEQMSDAERIQVIGPVMNKRRAILTRTSLRLMLGQSAGIDLGSLFRERKIIMVPLSQGIIGTDASRLLGSLLVSLLWQETMSRASVPAEKRAPTFAYLDEFQEFIRFGDGDELAEMLALARGLGLGLILAHQYLDQLPGQVKSAVLGTARSQAVFQLAYSDANEMARRFAPLTYEDLSNLNAYEIALRPCVDSRTLGPVTGITSPLPERLRPAEYLADFSQQRHGTPRADVEAARLSRVQIRSANGAPVGRKGNQ
ncbi:hypothetical protein [Actinoallomurus sp. NPDC050550]|uniref:type IV secretory system conjugative DNA transfer family protein n=1 Tax=Actinoallomurus sp. NPDC050550 TaxID=3154937 RepID=UPI0033C121E6